MENENKTQFVIDALNNAGIKAVKVDAPIFEISVGNDKVPVMVYSNKGESVNEGIEYIISQKPLVVFVKDVYVEEQVGTMFRFSYITI